MRQTNCCRCGKVMSSYLPAAQATCQACRRELRQRSCQGCGTQFHARDRRQRFCGFACWELTTWWRPTTCEMCGATYKPSYTGQRTCGRACGVALRKEKNGTAGQPRTKWPNSKVYIRNCAWCERVFVARYANRKVCSDECSRLRIIGQVLNRHYGFVNNAMREKPLLAYLTERDRGRCGICHKPVRAKAGPMKPSIDHIIPRSRGGSDEIANLQLAHFQCNLSKSNRGGGEQLLLIG